MSMTWVPFRTHVEGKRGAFDDVAQIIISAECIALEILLPLDDGVRIDSLERSANLTFGKRDSNRVFNAIERGLTDRLTIVHTSTEGKHRRCKSTCASICLPAPNVTI